MWFLLSLVLGWWMLVGCRRVRVVGGQLVDTWQGGMHGVVSGEGTCRVRGGCREGVRRGESVFVWWVEWWG